MTKGNLGTNISVETLISMSIYPENTEIYTLGDTGLTKQLFYGPTSKIPDEFKNCRVQFCNYTGAENLQIRIAQS